MSLYEPIPPVPDEHHIPDGAKCQEASPFSVTGYVPCSAPATSIVRHEKDHRSYYMCTSCCWHNVQNRGGQLMFSRPDKQEQKAVKSALDSLEEHVYPQQTLGTHVPDNRSPEDIEFVPPRKPFTPKPEAKPKRAKGGKYAAFVNDLPRYPGDDPDRRAVVESVKQSILEPLKDDEMPGDSAEVYRLLDDMHESIDRLIYVERRATAGKPWASEFARLYAELRMIRDHIEGWDKSIGLLLEAYLALMTEQMEVEGITSMKLANGQPVSTYLEPYAQVQDKEAFRQWCIEQGLERQMALPWQTTNSLTKQMLLSGEAEPPGVTVYAKTKVRLGGGE